MKLHWIDTGWGCGGILSHEGIVRQGAPIFKRLFGVSLDRLRKIYRVIDL